MALPKSYELAFAEYKLEIFTAIIEYLFHSKIEYSTTLITKVRNYYKELLIQCKNTSHVNYVIHDDYKKIPDLWFSEATADRDFILKITEFNESNKEVIEEINKLRAVRLILPRD